jgi:hypothetical protein
VVLTPSDAAQFMTLFTAFSFSLTSGRIILTTRLVDLKGETLQLGFTYS